MGKTIGVVDLFSGPGGLGEGFSAFRDQGGFSPYSIKVSIEKEAAAHATLRLRSFLRKFGNVLPGDYYEFLNGRCPEPDWSRLYPDHWEAADSEARRLELGSVETSRFLTSRIAEIRRDYGDHTVLIGGPPCQAYSLAGRSRNAGIADYVPHNDERNFLYQRYVDVLRQLEPAAFVMENVKGMLSSAIKGDGIFQKVMSDLRSALGKGSYRLMALDTEPEAENFWEPAPSDFVVRTEKHGIPQARHRVIIIGLRQDVARGIRTGRMPRLRRYGEPPHVGQVIGSMPRLRSGLSRHDDLVRWKEAVEAAIHISSEHSAAVPKKHGRLFLSSLADCRVALQSQCGLERAASGGTGLANSSPEWLRDWLTDPKLERLPNNDTRSHMPSDLARYLYAAVFGRAVGRSPKASEFPAALAPNHRNWESGKFADRFRVQVATRPSSTITSHISKDGHYFIHPDPSQCRSLTVREAARLQTFPDNYFFKGNRTQQYVQVGNAVPPFLALQIAEIIWNILSFEEHQEPAIRRSLTEKIEI